MEENKNAEEKNNEKLGFFKKEWYSVTKIEKYPDMAAQGLGKAMNYLTKLVICLSIIVAFGILFTTQRIVNKTANYLQNEFPDFAYQDGELKVESQEVIEINENGIVGKIIVDTNTDSEEQINKYLNSIEEAGDGIVILKDKVLIKTGSVSGTISYSYKETLDSFKIDNFNKQDVINYVNSTKVIVLYLSAFLTIFIYAFIIYFVTICSDAIFLSLFGFVTTYLAKIRMRYVAIFNMSVYALTLSVILDMLYILINTFTSFNIEYFQVMYVSVAAIYLVAAILILKTEFMNKQMELMKIAETQEIIKQQIEEKKRKEEEQKEKEEQNKEDKKQEKKEEKEEQEDVGQEPEGTNA